MTENGLPVCYFYYIDANFLGVPHLRISCWQENASSSNLSKNSHDSQALAWPFIVQWKRRLETFGADDSPIIASGLNGKIDSICNLGELTDEGRMSTWQLGTRLRRLYIDQLKFMPSMIEDADMIYLRATPIPRALESLQQAFWGMVSEIYFQVVSVSNAALAEMRNETLKASFWNTITKRI